MPSQDRATAIQNFKSYRSHACMGTENYYKHPLARVCYTDGMAAVGRFAWWLVSDTCIARGHVPELKDEPFLVWRLEQMPNGTWSVSAWDDEPYAQSDRFGPSSRCIFRQDYPGGSDFPDELLDTERCDRRGFEFWMEIGGPEGMPVAMLKEER